MFRFLSAGLALALMAGCSITYVPPKQPLPLLTEPSAGPTLGPSRGQAAGNVACSKTIGSAAGYTLFGAPAPDFNAGHPGAQLLIRCATDGKVIVLQLDISPPARAAQALAIARRQLPADLSPVYDHSQPTCRDVQLRSATLASVLGSDDPGGAVNVELESALAPAFKYDGSQVDTVVIHQQDELNQTGPCVRS